MNLEEQNAHWVGRLDVLFVQRDNNGNQFNGLDDTINLRLGKENYEKFVKNGFVYTKLVARADEAKTIRIVVRDSVTGAVGSVTVPRENFMFFLFALLRLCGNALLRRAVLNQKPSWQEVSHCSGTELPEPHKGSQLQLYVWADGGTRLRSISAFTKESG